MLRKTLILIASFALCCLSAAAQTIVGSVKDSKGEPVISAAVMIKGQTKGVLTDLDGRYSIEAAKGDILVFSCIGFKTIEKQCGEGSELNVVMEDDSNLLNEVVVVGYGEVRKSDLTGSVSSVNINEEIAATSQSLDQMLQGRAAGVSVTSNDGAPGGGMSITIRGNSSFNGGGEPLYVVDGIILNSSVQSQSMFTVGNDNASQDTEMNGLLGIAPDDIEKMEILKDASATAIYGALGANGVVLITTKSGAKGKSSITYSAGVTYQRRSKKMDMLSYSEYIDYYHDQYPLTDINWITSGVENGTIEPMDWQDYIMRDSFSQRHSLSFSGRSKNANHLISLGYKEQNGIITGTGMKQLTFRLNFDIWRKGKLKIGSRSSLAFYATRLTQANSAGNMTSATSLTRSMLNSAPYRNVDLSDNVDDLVADTEYARADKWLKDFSDDVRQIRITPSIYAEYKFAKWLSYKLTLGGDYMGIEHSKWKGPSISQASGSSIAAASYANYLMFNVDNMLNFNFNFGKKHRLSGTTGVTYVHKLNTTASAQGWNIFQYKPQFKSIMNAPQTSQSYSEVAYSSLSYLIRAIYSFRKVVSVTATYRLDGSSRFAKANRFSHFPSFSAAWNLSESDWYDVAWMPVVKFRGGWGMVGNQAVAAYKTLQVYSNSSYADHISPSGIIKTVYASNIANPDLKWETTSQFNIGADFSLWYGKIEFSVDAYDKTTYDLLQSVAIPNTSGFSTMWVNRGTIRNRGLELELTVSPIRTSDWRLDISGNISFNRNRIIDIGQSSGAGVLMPDGKVHPYFQGNNVGTSSYVYGPATIFVEGYPMGLFWGYKTDGIVQEGETGPGSSEGMINGPGAVKYVDLNDDGYMDTSNDRTVIGDPNPDFTYGFSVDFRWKDLSLSLGFNGSYGNDILNANLAQEYYTGSSYNVRRGAYYDRWTPTNTSARYPAFDGGTTDGVQSGISIMDARYLSDRHIEDGSFLRLATASLAYKFNFKDKAIKSLSLALSANNLFVLTRYSGWDPEVNSYGSDMLRRGVDFGSYPKSRALSLDLKLGF